MDRTELKQFLLSGICHKIHFVGIGGAGMSPIASLCKVRGFDVTGSDLEVSPTTKALFNEGIKVYSAHKAENIISAQLVVISSAIKESNPEVGEAVSCRIPVVSRALMLGALMEDSFGIGIAGTHGKTSSTSICATMFESLAFDPTVVVGGRPAGWPSNLRYGSSKYFLVEADESDGSFLDLPCKVVLITNIDDDHMDFYGSMDSLCDYFVNFINAVGPHGLAVLCCDDKNICAILTRITVPFVTYGVSENSDYRISKVSVKGFVTSFSLCLPQGRILEELCLNAPGIHYALNCVGCCAIADFLGADHESLKEAVAAFTGVGRRFEVVGSARGVNIVDDYAHHPTEISAVLAAFSGSVAGRIIVAFQPHRIDRTKRLAVRLGASLSLADIIYILPVYRPAGGGDNMDSSAELIYQSMSCTSAFFLKGSSLRFAAREIAKDLRAGDLLLTIGAGSITGLGPMVLNELNRT